MILRFLNTRTVEHRKWGVSMTVHIKLEKIREHAV
jgi:hypothetical protein